MSNKPKAHAIGGIFFRSKDPEASKRWYQQHLGFNVDEYGTNFIWRKDVSPEERGFTLWAPFKHDTNYFGQADQQFMINYRVDNLEQLVETLRGEGVQIVDEIVTESYGKFVHVVDADGRQIELWEAIDNEYEKLADGTTS